MAPTTDCPNLSKFLGRLNHWDPFESFPAFLTIGILTFPTVYRLRGSES